MAVALDSDAVIGFLDAGDALHDNADARVRELIRAGEVLVASVVSFAEVLTGAKLGHHREEVVRGFFEEVLGEVVPVDVETASRAAELRAAQPTVRMPDALILATADVSEDIDTLVCGDRGAPKARGLNCRVELLG